MSYSDENISNLTVFSNQCENEDVYRSLFKNSNAAMLLIDTGTSEIVDANVAACDFYGWSHEELLNKKIDQINTLTPEKIKTEMQDAVLEMRNYFFFKHMLSNGKIRDVEVYSSPVVINSRKLLYSIVHDITERKTAENELKKKKIQLSTAQKVGHVGSYEIDLNANKVDASDEAARIYGVKSGELGLKEIKSIPLPQHRQALDKALNDLVINSVPYNMQFKIKRKNDGEMRDIHSIAEFYEKRNVIIGTIQDVTEFRQVENALLRAKLIAEAANRSKDEFLATMSHELRTPLTSIIGFSDILLDERFGDLNDKQKRYIGHVLSGGEHLLGIINNILDLSKIEAGKMELYREDFVVYDAINEVKMMINPLSSKKNISVTVTLDQDINCINADRTKFKQILYNLLSNAIKFTDKKGSVTVHGKKVDGMMEICVKDNGIGILADDQKELFQPFKQLDPHLNSDFEGTGLGLALVKKFLEMHDGDIRVESELGVGSTFTFVIPCK